MLNTYVSPQKHDQEPSEPEPPELEPPELNPPGDLVQENEHKMPEPPVYFTKRSAKHLSVSTITKLVINTIFVNITIPGINMYENVSNPSCQCMAHP